jgi:large repetitive protein
LSSSNTYTLEACGITDLVGQQLCFVSSFTTGLGQDATPLTVTLVSPASGSTAVPVNAQVVVQLSKPVDPVSVSNDRNAVVVSTGGSPVPGTVSVSGDSLTLTFAPTNPLLAGTVYTVAVSGFTDLTGKLVTPFSSLFTTDPSGVVAGGLAVTAVNPASGATDVPVNSSIALTFNEVVNPATVNANTVQVFVFTSSSSGGVAGNYAVSGTSVTFTPVSPYPANATVEVIVSNVQDLAGNPTSFSSTFTTGATVDTTPPQVQSVSPLDGATDIGLNATVVLTFSKSLNPATLAQSLALLSNGKTIGGFSGISSDNRTVKLSGSLASGSTVTVVATNGVQDLSGNALADFSSSFTTANLDLQRPLVVSQRPGNATTGVPVNSNIVLFINKALDASTINSALHVSQNGVVVSGSVQVTDGGQTIQFTPSAPWSNNALIEVFLDNTAQDLTGFALTNYQASFRTAPDLTSSPPDVVSVSPTFGVPDVPLNVIIDVQYDKMLNPATVAGAVSLQDEIGNPVAATVTLDANGQVIHIAPNAILAASSFYSFTISKTLQDVNGLSPSNLFSGSFETGTASDTVAPQVKSITPPNQAVNVGNNANVVVRFSEPINPITVTGTTIKVSVGANVIPSSISFSNANQDVTVVPQAPLPNASIINVTVSGVKDLAGNPVGTSTTQFTTGTGPDVTAPTVVTENPFNGATNVPLNTVISVQMSEPVDGSTVNKNTFPVFDGNVGTQLTGTYSVSNNGQTVSFVPDVPLRAGGSFSDSVCGITDLAGNFLNPCVGFGFTAGFVADTVGPQVTGISPLNALTGVPTNTQVVIIFDEPVDALTIGQVTLTHGAPVAISQSFTNGNQMLVLTPLVPLNPSTVYTVNITGVRDISGQLMSTPVTSTFTTGTGADLIAPTVTGVSPLNGATGVPTNTVVELQFSERVDALTVNSGTFFVLNNNTGLAVEGTITVAADGKSATLTPAAALSSSNTYTLEACGITDLVGQQLCFVSSFTTQ